MNYKAQGSNKEQGLVIVPGLLRCSCCGCLFCSSVDPAAVCEQDCKASCKGLLFATLLCVVEIILSCCTKQETFFWFAINCCVVWAQNLFDLRWWTLLHFLRIALAGCTCKSALKHTFCRHVFRWHPRQTYGKSAIWKLPGDESRFLESQKLCKYLHSFAKRNLAYTEIMQFCWLSVRIPQIY